MKKLFYLLYLVLTISSCKTSQSFSLARPSSEEIEVLVLHFNDAYEISPLENGKVGGLSRVASVRKELLTRNPNTITVLSGDFLNPSLLSSMKYDGKNIRGKQMVETLNALGVDWVGLGNHEFDLTENELQTRINESKFHWLASNAFHRLKDSTNRIEPFAKISEGQKDPFPKTTILTFTDKKNKTVKIGLFAIVLPATKKDYVQYEDFNETAKKMYEILKPQCDFVVGITHLKIADDMILAKELPNVPLLLGGHDHNNMIFHVENTTVAKADANCKTVYIHQLLFNPSTKQIKVKSILKPIDESIKKDEEVEKVVDKWEDIMEKSFQKLGLNAEEVVTTLTEPLDGRESINRNEQTHLGNVIAKAMMAANKKASDCAIFNSGSIRIDDQLSGVITQMDVMRVLPFGGKVVEVSLKGTLLKQVLEVGLKNKGSGGYLQWEKINYDVPNKQWLIDGKVLDETQTYHVMTSDFLISGQETNLAFFNKKNPLILQINEPHSEDTADLRNDIRKALIMYLKK